MFIEMNKFKEIYPDWDTDDNSFKLHVCKISCGWNPLFEKTKFYSSFKEIKKFYFDNPDIIIIDEYDEHILWEQFEETIRNHHGKDHIVENDNPYIKYYYDDEKFEFTNEWFR